MNNWLICLQVLRHITLYFLRRLKAQNHNRPCARLERCQSRPPARHLNRDRGESLPNQKRIRCKLPSTAWSLRLNMVHCFWVWNRPQLKATQIVIECIHLHHVIEVLAVLNQPLVLLARSMVPQKRSLKAGAIFATAQLSGDRLRDFCFRGRASAKVRKLLCSQLATRAQRQDLMSRRSNRITLWHGAAKAIPSLRKDLLCN